MSDSEYDSGFGSEEDFGDGFDSEEDLDLDLDVDLDVPTKKSKKSKKKKENEWDDEDEFRREGILSDDEEEEEEEEDEFDLLRRQLAGEDVGELEESESEEEYESEEESEEEYEESGVGGKRGKDSERGTVLGYLYTRVKPRPVQPFHISVKASSGQAQNQRVESKKRISSATPKLATAELSRYDVLSKKRSEENFLLLRQYLIRGSVETRTDFINRLKITALLYVIYDDFPPFNSLISLAREIHYKLNLNLKYHTRMEEEINRFIRLLPKDGIPDTLPPDFLSTS